MIADALERCIARSHRIRVWGRPYHPYFLMTDLGFGAVIALAWVVARTAGPRPAFGFLAFLGAFATMNVAYAAALQARRRLFGVSSRSFLQDTLLILLPVYLLASVALGNSLATSLDLAGMALPLGLAFIRVGCFLGGCCYGVPWRFGVRYPAELLRPIDGCRRYRPGPPPTGRVLPIQLAESACNAALFLALFGWWRAAEGAVGRVLPAYLLAYGTWRFGSDFARGSSARPARAGLSEAQWVSAAVVLVCAAVLAVRS